MSNDEAYVDELIEGWRVATEPLVTGVEAIRRFEGLIDLSEEWAKVSEYPSSEWRPEHAFDIQHSIEDERAEALLAGDEPTGEELQLWESEYENKLTYADLVWAYRLNASSGRNAWFCITTDGLHQGSMSIDAAGPFLEHRTLTSYLGERAKAWDDWWVADGSGEGAEELMREVERLAGKPPLNGP